MTKEKSEVHTLYLRNKGWRVFMMKLLEQSEVTI